MIGTQRMRQAFRRLIAGPIIAQQQPQLHYRFLVKNWTAITDADLASRVLGTEYFKEQLQPVRLPIEDIRSFLVLAPHQDDEVIGAGGTLALASKFRAAVRILFTTDGEQRGKEDTRRIRDEEALEVCSHLGATHDYLGISNICLNISLKHVDKLADMIRSVRPDVILSPWLLDAPPKHRMVNHLLWLTLLRGCNVDCEVWGYQVHNVVYPNGYVEITPVADRKRELIRCYRSQLEKYYRYDHIAMGMAAWNSRFLPDNKGNPNERYAEVFFALPFAELARLIEQYYFTDLASTYKGHKKLMQQFHKLHSEIAGAPALSSMTQ